jgi:ribosome biogenesis GTPase
LSDLLVAYGLDDRVATLFGSFQPAVPIEPTAQGQLRLARIVRVDRTSCLAVTAGGLRRVETTGLVSRRAGLDDDPATGDWVVLACPEGADPAVVGVLPRRSAISRRAPEDRQAAVQVLAANVDLLAVVAGLDRPLSANRLERSLVVAWESGAQPVVVLTKADAAGELSETVALAQVAAGAVDVLVTSAARGEGIEELAALVQGGRTLALIGPSGAGKSTLVNSLVGADVQRTGGVRLSDTRGRHTTTSRELVPVPGGGVLLDTPGLRSVGLLDAETGMATTFSDVEELAARCRFGDCGHRGEPGCAVSAAVEAGQLDARRLGSYQKLRRELAREERQQPGTAGFLARQAWRTEHIARIRAARGARHDPRRSR